MNHGNLPRVLSRWFFLTITFPDLLQVGINIALFTFLGFLLYERLTSRVRGRGAKSRRNIRKIAKYYLASTFLLFLAYFLDYARGNSWPVMIFTASTLRMLEGTVAFLGFVALLAPLYPLAKMLSVDVAISEVSLPELNQTLVGGFTSLFYFAILWGQSIQEQTILVKLIELAIIIGLIGIFGVIALSNEEIRWQRTKSVFFWLFISPWVAIPALVVLHSHGLF
jgi:hypothetical protein